jgi:hypothetical protein
MRTRLIPAGAVLALLLGLLTAAPAAAAYTVSITFPGNFSEFYSPFSGPATVHFTFDGSENDATFNFRIRPAGGAVVHRKNDVLVDADDPNGSVDVAFKWSALSVNSARTYVVQVYRNDVKLASESFSLRPRLATITGATPNPFFPWMDDGYKDTTSVRYTLLENAVDAEARVFKANGAGKCCGDRIRTDDLNAPEAGVNHWIWDGQGDGAFAGNRPRGNYFVKIWADDGTVAPALSKPKKIAIARTYRATKTDSKPGTAYHHTTESALVRGGDCFLHNQGTFLQVDCHGAKMTVYYRWGLGSDERIEKASFVIDDPNNECPPARRNPGHSKHESYLAVTDSVSGITSCHIVTAKITYSYLKPS